jgi:general secretion pathway protein A
VFILTDLGHAPPPGTPKLQLLQALNGELLDTLARGGNVVVLIDEAQDLSIPVLEELRLLSNLETAKEKILQFVLAGQPELDGMLARPELRQLRQRIAVPARLRTLGKGEVAAYVAARISAAGGDARGIFAPSALRQLYQFSRGVPRLVNVACDSALVTAYAAGTRLVDGKIMREAIRDLRRGPYRVSAIARWRTRIATVAIAGLVGAVMGLGASRLAGGPLAHRHGGEGGVPAGDATPQEKPRQLSSGAPAPAAAEPQAARPGGLEEGAARATDVPQGAEAVPTPALATAALAVEVSASPAPPQAAAAAPEATEPRRVFVQAGDDLTHIARRNYGYVTQELLVEIQRAIPGLTNLDLVNTGQTIVLPPAPEGGPEPAQMPQAGAPAAVGAVPAGEPR